MVDGSWWLGKTINRAGYTWRGLPSAETSISPKKGGCLALRNPSLIRRPLIEHADGSANSWVFR
jgi:arsenate reductase-like glutaredoxin family protein